MGKYPVVKILNRLAVNGRKKYFVKWEGGGYGWEPEGKLDCPELIAEFEKTFSSSDSNASDKEKKNKKKRRKTTESSNDKKAKNSDDDKSVEKRVKSPKKDNFYRPEPEAVFEKIRNEKKQSKEKKRIRSNPSTSSSEGKSIDKKRSKSKEKNDFGLLDYYNSVHYSAKDLGLIL